MFMCFLSHFVLAQQNELELTIFMIRESRTRPPKKVLLVPILLDYFAATLFWSRICFSCFYLKYIFFFSSTYLVVAPKRIRPSMVIQVFVTILRLEFEHVNVKISVVEGKEMYAGAELMFDRPGSRIMQMRVRHLLFMHKEYILFCYVSVFIHL